MIICIVVIIISWYLYFSISSFIIVMESFRLHSANQISILFFYLITFLLRSLPSCCWVGCGLFSWLEYHHSIFSSCQILAFMVFRLILVGGLFTCSWTWDSFCTWQFVAGPQTFKNATSVMSMSVTYSTMIVWLQIKYLSTKAFKLGQSFRHSGAIILCWRKEWWARRQKKFFQGGKELTHEVKNKRRKPDREVRTCGSQGRQAKTRRTIALAVNLD